MFSSRATVILRLSLAALTVYGRRIATTPLLRTEPPVPLALFVLLCELNPSVVITASTRGSLSVVL